jgi:hypothetical protein
MSAVVFAGFGAAGCVAAHRPDADVARAVEAADRQRVAAITLASADDELPVALPAAGRVAVDAGPGIAPPPVASVPGNGAADRYFSATREEGPRSFTFSMESNDSFGDEGREDSGGRSGEGANGKPKLRLQLFRFTVLGRPVGLRCGIKKKHLMFGAKITL